MADRRFDIAAIGNAIFDILVHVEDDFLVAEGLVKGSMRLVDGAESARLYNRIGPAVRTSGGSAGNTAAGLASLGGEACYFGKVTDDDIGHAYAHDMRSQGVHFDVPMLPPARGLPSATSIILVTPDGERTMNTHLAACKELTPDDIEAELIRQSAVTYMEGYLWDEPHAKDAFRKAAEIAKTSGRRVALTLSDSFCADRFRAEFLDLIRSGTVDTLFANEHEIRSLYQTADLKTAVDAMAGDVDLGIVTLGAEGSLSVQGDVRVTVPASKVNEIVDLTGAGDLFAAGYLFGLTRAMPLETCAELGALAAGEVISHMGPRPQGSLKQAAVDAGLLAA